MVERRPDSDITPAQAFATAVKELGGQSATARLLGVSQQAISAKLGASKPCSPTWAVRLAEATSLSEHDLRPDLYKAEPGSATRAEISGLEPVR